MSQRKAVPLQSGALTLPDGRDAMPSQSGSLSPQERHFPERHLRPKQHFIPSTEHVSPAKRQIFIGSGGGSGNGGGPGGGGGGGGPPGGGGGAGGGAPGAGNGGNNSDEGIVAIDGTFIAGNFSSPGTEGAGFVGTADGEIVTGGKNGVEVIVGTAG